MIFKKKIIKKRVEEHQDLIRFEKKYNERIKKFLESNQETKIAFLNADFGWGKTTFIKNNLDIQENCIYSPWLNPSDNYLNEIYYHVWKKDKGKISSWTLIFTMWFTVASILIGNIISLLENIYTSDSMVCKIVNYQLVCTQNNDLLTLIRLIAICSLVVIVVLSLYIYIKPIPLINFFKKENGQYYEDKIIKYILKKVESVLVIEDIDRIDDIENVLIVANKISSYIKQHQIKNKYILLTGDYARVIERINNPNTNQYGMNHDINMITYKSKGVDITERIISLRIDFSSLKDRIDNLLIEYNLTPNLTKIEYDDIINFIKLKYISVRFFTRFLEDNKENIQKGNSLYHLLVNYYFDQKYFNLELNHSNYKMNCINVFPNCLNDIEILLSRKNIKINNIVYEKFEKTRDPKYNYEIITNNIIDLLFLKKEHAIEIFSKFFKNECYPVIPDDIENGSSKYVNIGQSLKGDLKNSIDDYLLGYNNGNVDNGSIIPIKRCYFANIKNNNYDNYKINQVLRNGKVLRVESYNFFYAYFGCFFRKNIKEFEKNYPKLYDTLMEIINEKKEVIPVVESTTENNKNDK